MSLSSLLTARRGPLWDWFLSNFPATQATSTELNRELRGGPATAACPLPRTPDSDASLVGTAIGYLLAAHLQPRSLDATKATEGAAQLDRRLARRGHARAGEAELASAARLRAALRDSATASADAWEEACLMALVLARFEQWFRAGPAVAGLVLRPLRHFDGDLFALADELQVGESLRDLAALGRVTLEDHAHLRNARELHLGCEFAQTVALRGADADVICDGRLLDLKSTAGAQVVGRHELWQLLGYLLADTDDRYRIRLLGYAALRWRRTVVWPVDRFLHTLGGDPAKTLNEWRDEFAEVVAGLAVTGPRAPTDGHAIGEPTHS